MNFKKITLKHLISRFGEEQGIQLLKSNEKHLFDYHGLAWALGKIDLKYFCEVFLYNLLFNYNDSDKIPLSKTHYEIWHELEDTILNRNNTKNCYVFPRGFGKSTTITVPLAIWCALYRIHPFVVIDSATEAQSQNFIATVKMCIEDNKLIESAFGKVVNKDLKYNISEIELDIKPERSKIQSVSSTSSVRGINYGSNRIGLLILDDAQDEKQITTEQSTQALVDRIENGIMKALQNQNNHVVALGTIQRKNDVYDTFVNSIGWRTRTEKCIQIDDIDTYFTKNEHWQKFKEILLSIQKNPNAEFDAYNYNDDHIEQMRFPVIWDNYKCPDMAIEYYRNPVSFKKERQCDIHTLGQRRITSMSKIEELQIESMPFHKTILSVDPASTDKKKSDFSAFCVLSENQDNRLKYARKILVRKYDGEYAFNDYINMIVLLLKRYTDIQCVSIEKQVYSGADVNKLREILETDHELKGRDIMIINKSRSKNKDNRISTIIPDINCGRIIFNSSSEDAEALAQIAEFSGCAYTPHDDAIDALTDAMEYINLITLSNYQKVQFISFDDLGFF